MTGLQNAVEGSLNVQSSNSAIVAQNFIPKNIPQTLQVTQSKSSPISSTDDLPFIDRDQKIVRNPQTDAAINPEMLEKAANALKNSGAELSARPIKKSFTDRANDQKHNETSAGRIN